METTVAGTMGTRRLEGLWGQRQGLDHQSLWAKVRRVSFSLVAVGSLWSLLAGSEQTSFTLSKDHSGCFAEHRLAAI